MIIGYSVYIGLVQALVDGKETIDTGMKKERERAKIAFEKAGILKHGVTAIVGPQKDDALEVIEHQAEKVGAPLLLSL